MLYNWKMKQKASCFVIRIRLTFLSFLVYKKNNKIGTFEFFLNLDTYKYEILQIKLFLRSLRGTATDQFRPALTCLDGQQSRLAPVPSGVRFFLNYLYIRSCIRRKFYSKKNQISKVYF